jgi:uncharacterized protein YkwD
LRPDRTHADAVGVKRVAVLLAALAALAAAPAGSGGSATVRALPLEQELLRAVNAERGARGLRPLRLAPGLQRAAVGHSRAMVAGGFFAHASRDGTQMAERVRRSYPPRGGAWSVGENLIWASPRLGARQAVRSWLGSPGHRANLLAPAWRDVGIGAVRTTGAGGVFGRATVIVVTMDFGTR